MVTQDDLDGLIEASPTELLEKRIWKQRDGTLTPLKEMTDSHLVFSLNMIEDGRLAKRAPWIPVLTEEINRRNLKKKIENL